MEDDKVLVKQILEGDEEALTRFFESYADALFNFIYSLMNDNRQDAEDVWQETLVAAVNSLASFKAQSRLFTWMCAIARLKVAGFYRQTKKALPLEGNDGFSVEHLETMIDHEPLPEALINRRETRCKVIETLQALPEEYRLVLLARYQEELSVEETSKRLNRSYKATESLLSRARLAFKEKLSQKGDL